MNPDFVNAIIGGLMIGISAVMMLGLIGRITGISGILWQAANPSNTEPRTWRILFIVGLVVGPIIANALLNWEYPNPPQGSTVLAIIAGLLVGFGTILGSGCTSGHGVCGIGRLSVRSMSATITFMATGIITVAVVNAISL